jgi:hypothetical protein
VGPRPAAHFLNPRAGGAITPDTTRQSPKTRTGLEVGVSDVVARVGQISPSRLPTKTRRSKRSKRTKDERGGGGEYLIYPGEGEYLIYPGETRK